MVERRGLLLSAPPFSPPFVSRFLGAVLGALGLLLNRLTSHAGRAHNLLVDETYDVLYYDIHDLYVLWKASNSYAGGYTQETTPIGPSIYYRNVAG